MIPQFNDAFRTIIGTESNLGSQVDISFDLPNREWAAKRGAKPALNIYLYDIRENHQLRDTDWVRKPGPNGNGKEALKSKPPVRIDLSYMVTAWAAEVEDEHTLLWRALAVLMKYRVLPRDMLQGDLKAAVERLNIDVRMMAAQPEGVLKQSTDFWTAIENQLKPSINLVVTVPLDLEESFTSPLVFTRRLRFPSDSETVEIGGTVTKKGKPEHLVIGAQVAITGHKGALTDAYGRYRLHPIPTGKHRLLVTVPGEKAREFLIEVPEAADEAATYDVEV